MKLYVSNLPYAYGDGELQELFATIGEVLSAKVITDRFSGRSKGFGFVEMSDDDAKKAIADLNGKEVDGRALVVNEARPPNLENKALEITLLLAVDNINSPKVTAL